MNLRQLYFIFPGVLLALGLSNIALAAGKTVPAAVTSNARQNIIQLQQEIQAVQNSIPAQVGKEQAARERQIVSVQRKLEKQIKAVQRQIQQVQNELTRDVNAVQKEVHEEEMVR